jgi:hypothetical protein
MALQLQFFLEVISNHDSNVRSIGNHFPERVLFMGCLRQICLCIFVIVAASSSWARSEADLVVRHTLQDLKLKEKYRKQDLMIQKKYQNFFALMTPSSSSPSCQEKCESVCEGSENPGSGSASCWDKCSQEGYSSSTCSERCGTGTTAGSASCWDKCTQEGYGSSTCSDRCGTSTSGGSSSCWGKCTSEGYGSSTCSDRCGTSTSGGSGACWQKCTSEGYGSSTCSERCGTN